MCTHCYGIRRPKQGEVQSDVPISSGVISEQVNESAVKKEILPLPDVQVTRRNPFGERRLPFKCM